MNWERAWIIASALLLIAAAILVWWNNLSAAFVTAALGACAWFLSYRAQLRGKLAETEESDEDGVSTGSGSDRVETKMTIKRATITFLLLLLLSGFHSMAAASPSDESDVRNAVQHIFNQLKSGQYGSLYDSLPSSSRSRISRDRLVQGLRQSQDVFQLQRIEIGTVRVSGNLAVVDTVMYAHISKPFDADGKLVVQQYLVREDGNWRVATGDNATINTFLKNNPSFGKKFPIKKPQAFINQNGKWIPIPLGRR